MHEEAVALGLGQRVGALVLDRVLGGEHEERVGQRVRDAVDGDLALLHRLQQRGLGLRRRAVDLVGQHDAGEHRPGAEHQLAAAQRHRARDVGGQHVGRELQAPELDAQRSRRRARQQRLGDPRDAFEQHVTAERERGEHVLQRLFVADDDLADLARDAGVQLLHDDRSFSLLRFGPHQRGGERIDVGHARRRRLDVGILRRAEAPAGGPDRHERGQREPEQGPPDARRQPAEATRHTVAVHGLQERHRTLHATGQRQPERRAVGLRQGLVLQRRSVGEQRDLALAAAPRDQQRPIGRADRGQRAAELVPAAAVERGHLGHAGRIRRPEPACAAGRRRRAPRPAARRAPPPATKRRRCRPRRAGRRSGPTRRSRAPPRAPSRQDRAPPASRPSRGASSATRVRSRRTGCPSRSQHRRVRGQARRRCRVRRRRRPLRRGRQRLDDRQHDPERRSGTPPARARTGPAGRREPSTDPLEGV